MKQSNIVLQNPTLPQNTTCGLRPAEFVIPLNTLSVSESMLMDQLKDY